MKPPPSLHSKPDWVRRLFENLSIDSQTGCWNWTGLKDPGGYGILWICYGMNQTARSRSTHRMAYHWFRQSLIDYKGWHIHHICRNRACCNPCHLELLTQSAHARLQRAK